MAALLYLPWVPTLLFQAAHTGAPWSRKPGYEQTSRWRRRTGCSATRRGSCSWSRRAAAWSRSIQAGRGRELTAQGRAVARGRDRSRLGTVLLAYGASQFSPAWAMRYLAIAVPPFLLLVAAGLASARGLGILGLVIVVDPVGLRRVADDQEQRPRRRRRDRAEPSARRRRRLDPARADAGAAPLPAARAALRDAHRLREGRRRDRLARRRRAPRARAPRSATSSRSSTRSRPASGSSW